MDDQYQAKDHRAGHEGHGVQVCHKCGWPFPNPHPSAKHRRAHKKICGTIEGYKLVESEETALLTVSDEEHVSDGDHKTPSPKLLEKSANETVSVGMAQRSARSEDDVFSDAVAEFPDSESIPGMEVHPRCIREPATNAEIIAESDDRTNQSYEGDANTAITLPLNNSADSSLMQNTEVPKVNLFGSVHGSQDCVSSTDISSVAGPLTDSRSEVFSSKTCDDDGGYACDSDTNKLEIQSNANKDNNESSRGEDLTEHGRKQNDNSILDRQLMDDVLAAGQNAERASDAVLELGKAEDIALIPGQAAGIPLLEKEQTDDSKVNLNDVLPVAKHVGYVNASVDPVEIKIDAAGSDDLIESCNALGKLAKDMHLVAIEGCNALGELGKDMPVLSVPESTGNAEIMIEDFKDHNGGRLPQLIQGTSLEVGNDAKESVPKSNLSTSHVSVFPEDTAEQRLTDNLEQKYGSNKPMIKKLPDEEEADRSLVTDETKEKQISEELGTITAVEREKTNVIQAPEKKPPCDYKDEQLVMSLGEHAIEDLANLNPVNGTMGTEIRQTTGLAGINGADNYEKAAIERCDIDRDNDNKGMKSSIVNIIATFEPVDSLSGQEINTATVLIGDDNAADHEENEIEGYDVSTMGTGKGDSAAALVVDKLPMRAEATSNSTVDLHESCAFLESATDLFDFKLTDAEGTYPGGIQDAQEGIKELKTTVNDKGQGKHVGGICIPAEDVNVLDVKVTQESAEEHLTKVPPVSSLETSASILSPVIVEDNCATDVVGVASGNTSKFLTGEVESNLDSNAVLQQLGTSANDFSVDSSSQTDSLEGHWGSVSVLSTVSDIPTIVDAEPLRSNGFQAPAEPDEVSLKGLKAAAEGQQSDKSDVFEPPSFMTLVEPRVGIHQKNSASEIQHTQQEKTTSEAGWFPSLTNIVNESQGRKKNEKIIAKVANWNAGKQHSPLKSLLHEANVETKSKLPNATENPGPLVAKDGTTAKDDSDSLAMANSAMAPEAPHTEVTKREDAKEWNSPARYPAEIKREKKKVKGKPYWAQFVCCSSVS